MFYSCLISRLFLYIKTMFIEVYKELSFCLRSSLIWVIQLVNLWKRDPWNTPKCFQDIDVRLKNVIFLMACCIPVSGDWYCNKKGSSKIPCLATQGENGLGRVGYLRENVIASESLVSVKLVFHYQRKLPK